MVEFDRLWPLWVAAIAAAAVAWPAFVPGTPARRRIGAVAGAIAALLLGLAGAGIHRIVPDPAARLVVFAVDVSDSVPAAERTRAAAWVASAHAASAPARRVVLAFAGTAAVVVAVGEALPADLDAALAAADVPRGVTRLDPVLGLAAALRAPGEPAALVVCSDGAFVRHEPPPPPLPVSVVPLSGAPPNAVTCEGLEGPDAAEAGAPIALALRYRAAAGATAEVLVAEGPETLARVEVRLVAGGPHVLPLPPVALAAGAHVLTALVVIADAVPADNRAAFALTVAPPPTVRLVTRVPQGPAALLCRRALAAQGLPLETLAPDAVTPEALAAARVVVWDAPVPGDAAGPGGLAVAGFVRRGGGLLAWVGHDGWPGADPNAGLAAVLPADVPPPPAPPPPPETPPEPDPTPPPPDAPRKPREVEIVPVGIVLVIDRSGSMEGRRIQLAREAAIASLEMLAPQDRFGVLAFDEQARWVVDPAEPIRRDVAIERLTRLVAGGGTNLYPALTMARDALRAMRVGARHLVILSDGHDENVRDFRSLVEEMAREQITLSTVGVGEGFDSRLLTNLAAWGRGQFEFTVDPSRVPALVTEQVRWAVRRARPDVPQTPPSAPTPPPTPLPDLPPPPLIEPPKAEPIPLVAGVPHPATAGLALGAVPPVTRLRAITPRPFALALLQTGDGGPAWLLGHAGEGRVALFAGDLAAEAGEAFGAWPELPALLAQLIRFLGPPPPPPAVLSSTVDFVTRDGEPAAPTEGRARFALSGGPVLGPYVASGEQQLADGTWTPLAIARVGPAAFEARFAPPEPGVLVACRARIAKDGAEVAAGEAAAVRGPTAEETREVDPAALAALAAEAGGTVNPDPATIAATLPLPTRRVSLGWIALLCAAFLLVPVAWGVGEGAIPARV